MSGRKARQARKDQGQSANRRRWLTQRRLAYLAAAAALLAVTVGGIAIAHKSGGGSPIANASALTGGVSHAAAAPVLRGTDPVDGRKVSLAQFAGRPVVLNVWASWCTGCNQEAADLRRFATRHPSAQVLGIDTQDTTGGARAFYRRWHWQHPSIADPHGSLGAQLAVTGLPTTFFLDSRHRIVARIVGAGDLAEFDRGLQLALRR